jgi:hypothetical protein
MRSVGTKIPGAFIVALDLRPSILSARDTSLPDVVHAAPPKPQDVR